MGKNNFKKFDKKEKGPYRKRKGTKREENNDIKLEKKDLKQLALERIEKEVIERARLTAIKDKYVQKCLDSMKVAPEYSKTGDPHVYITKEDMTDQYTGVCIKKGQCVLGWSVKGSSFDLTSMHFETMDGRSVLCKFPEIKRISFNL